jgi:autoinducer 2-degrading protein
MLVVFVYVRVKPDSVASFVAATEANARMSRLEPGVARFDVVREREDPTRFVLVESYRTDDSPAAHKDTAHYKAWRDAVEPMMAGPRHSVKYTNVSPDDEGWG